MKESNNIETLTDISPTDFAYQLSLNYSSKISLSHKKEYGQFSTPVKVARFMANLSECKKGKIKILDPGCGIGILFCALIENLAKRKNYNLKEVELVC
jgi:adenine-specific DNA-methyltransferase